MYQILYTSRCIRCNDKADIIVEHNKDHHIPFCIACLNHTRRYMDYYVCDLCLSYHRRYYDICLAPIVKYPGYN